MNSTASTDTLIPSALLNKPGKILFISHDMLGDFTYRQNFLAAFAAAFPHLEMHIWIDFDRFSRTHIPARFFPLKKYIIHDWLSACPWLKKILVPTHQRNAVAAARAENYDIVVSLATLRTHRYAALARKLCPRGFVFGYKNTLKLLGFHRARAYKKLDASITLGDKFAHVTDEYARRFHQLFGLDVPPSARHPLLDIPPEWKQRAQDLLREWGFEKQKDKLVFINIRATNNKRCWPLAKALALIKAMQQNPRWRDAWFLLNAMPSAHSKTQAAIDRASLPRARAFSAGENFFQLPAMLAESSLIISVETSVMHLASAVRVPVVALMRMKNPDQAPIDSANNVVVTTAKRGDWMREIPVERVMAAVEKRDRLGETKNQET